MEKKNCEIDNMKVDDGLSRIESDLNKEIKDREKDHKLI
jgi:hypothetical protein